MVITPPLIGTNSTPEQRSVVTGKIYIYDSKEDKNYFLFDKQEVVPPLPTPTRGIQRIPTPTPNPLPQDPFADPERLNDNAASDREASEEDGHDRIQALLEELKKQNDAVDAALSRINDGSYGKCSVCGEEIASARLTIMPTATTCVKHQGQ
jgi:RNA polymerase-binding transcription factor DksA